MRLVGVYNSLLRPCMVWKPRYWILGTAAIVFAPPIIKKIQYRVIMGSSTSLSANDTFPAQKTDEEWRAVLSPQQVRCPPET